MLANKVGSDQRSAARSSAINAEDQRQIDYQNKQTGQFNQSLAKVAPDKVSGDVKQEAVDRTASDSKLVDEGGNYVPVTGSAPQEVSSSIARATRAALDRGKEQARLNANVSAISGVNQKNTIALGRDAQWQSIFANNQQRSSQILPLELEDANRSGAGWRTAGQVLGIASTATGMAGMAGGPSWESLFSSGAGKDVAPALYGVASPEFTQAAYGASPGAQPGTFRRWF